MQEKSIRSTSDPNEVMAYHGTTYDAPSAASGSADSDWPLLSVKFHETACEL